MKVLFLLAFLFGCAYAESFDPKSIDDAIVIYSAPCKQYLCVLATKDNKKYIVVVDAGGPLFIYEKTEKDIVLLWVREWI